MKQQFYDYRLWEDYKNGMYRMPSKEEHDYLIQKSITLLSDHIQLKEQMIKVVDKWQISSKENLTNRGCNRRAWLGWSACSIKFRVPEIITREAWFLITEEQRILANQSADKAIKYFEENHKDLIYGKNSVIS